MRLIRNIFRQIKVIGIMGFSLVQGRAYLKKHSPKTMVYCHSAGGDMQLDLYMPETVSGDSLPLIVWFHGGAWKLGSRLDMEKVVAEQLEKGFAIASVSYSLSKVARWPVQIHEAKAALRYLRGNAEALGLDEQRFIAAGMSAGAHMACMLGVSAQNDDLNGALGEHEDQSNAVQGVLALYPPTDFRAVPEDYDGLLDYYAEKSPVTELLGESIRVAPQKSDLASPVRQATPECPPVLILHGREDPIVPFSQSELLHETLSEMGVDSQLMLFDDYTHGDYHFNQGQPAEAVNSFFARWL